MLLIVERFQVVKIHPSSSLADKMVPAIIYDELVRPFCVCLLIHRLLNLTARCTRRRDMRAAFPLFREASLLRYQC